MVVVVVIVVLVEKIFWSKPKKSMSKKLAKKIGPKKFYSKKNVVQI